MTLDSRATVEVGPPSTAWADEGFSSAINKEEDKMTRRIRFTLWPILAIAVALIVAPLALSLPTKASAGQKMLNDFRPIMQPAAVQTTVNYYYNTFTALSPVATGGTAASAEIPQLFAQLAGALHMTQPQLAQFLGANFPAIARLLENFPQLVPIFNNVPPGLTWYKPLVTTMHNNVSNYAQIDSLPNFNLFTWFFEIPGVLLVVLAGFGLFESYRFPRGRQTTMRFVASSSGSKAA